MLNTLSDILVSQFKDDLKAATTLVLESVRDGRLEPNEGEMHIMTTGILKDSSRSAIRQDSATIDSNVSVSSQMSRIRYSGKRGEELASDFVTLFRLVLPDKISRRLLSVKFLSYLPWRARALRLKRGDHATCDPQTTPSRNATDEFATSKEISWDAKVAIALGWTEAARDSGETVLRREATELRRKVQCMLQKQELYSQLVKDTMTVGK